VTTVSARPGVRYRERLTVPPHWWLIAAVGVAVAGFEVWAGFPWWVGLVAYVGIGVPTFGLLAGMSREVVLVDDRGVHAGNRTLPLEVVTAAQPVEQRMLRRLLGPGGDPSAHVVARGYIRTAVVLQPGDDDRTPYWLVSTRHPDRLMAAVRPPSP
jgi:hypothetical protein